MCAVITARIVREKPIQLDTIFPACYVSNRNCPTSVAKNEYNIYKWRVQNNSSTSIIRITVIRDISCID